MISPYVDASAFVCCASCIICLFGSALLILTILRSRPLRCHHRNCIFLGILFADFMMGVFALPLMAEMFINRGIWDYGCLLVVLVVEYIRAAFPFLTLWGLVVLNVDRIVRHYLAMRLESSQSVGIALGILPWLWMLIIVIPIAASTELMGEDIQACSFQYNIGYEKGQTAVSCFLPSFILCFTIIMVLLRKPTTRLEDPDQTTLLIQKDDDVPELCATIAPIVVTSVVSMVMLLPTHIAYSVPREKLFKFEHRKMFLTVHLLAWALPAVFPFLLLTDPDIRNEVKIAVHCRTGEKLIAREYNPLPETKTQEPASFMASATRSLTRATKRASQASARSSAGSSTGSSTRTPTLSDFGSDISVSKDVSKGEFSASSVAADASFNPGVERDSSE